MAPISPLFAVYLFPCEVIQVDQYSLALRIQSDDLFQEYRIHLQYSNDRFRVARLYHHIDEISSSSQKNPILEARIEESDHDSEGSDSEPSIDNLDKEFLSKLLPVNAKKKRKKGKNKTGVYMKFMKKEKISI